ncbi:MAG: hypothetical protein PHG65_02015 [Kiritimatiellae bacterium]|nr:hypothetical protein [Kiritimatiellia bacterium]
MPNTDFFDDDLIQKREGAKRIRMGAGDEVQPAGIPAAPSDTLPSRNVGDLNLTRMARHREEVEDSVAKTTEELERLRQRQEALERERRDLQELRTRQDDFESGRRGIIDRLGQTVLTLERDEIRAAQVTDLLGTTRQRFKTMLAELENLDPESWEENKIRDELGKALAIIEDARLEYKKSMSKIETIRERNISSDQNEPVLFEEPVIRSSEQQKSWGYWLKVGFAVSLPLLGIVIAIAITAFVLLARGVI